MKAVKWGVVGWGEQAQKRMVPALRKIKEIEISAVCCSSPETTRRAETELGVKGYAKLSEFLKDPEIQVVYLATPHHLHTPQAFKALEAGKNVLVEKPLAMSLDGVHKLAETARKYNLKIGCVFPLRFHPALKELQAEIKQGSLGELIQAEVYLSRGKIPEKDWCKDQFHSGPMCLMDLGLHGIDLMLWLTGKKVKEVFATGKGGQSDDILNTAIMLGLNFEDDTMGLVSANNQVRGETGLVIVHGSEEELLLEMHWPEGDGEFVLWSVSQGLARKKRWEPLDLYQLLAENFNLAVQGKASYAPGCEENYSVVETCCSAIESLKNGRIQKVGELPRVSASKYKE